MAHPRIIAQRQADAYQRLIAAADRLDSRFDVGDQVAALKGVSSRDAAFKQMLQSEALAALVERIAGVEGEPGETQEIDDLGADDPIVTVETVKEKPLKTTETVEIVDTGTGTVIDSLRDMPDTTKAKAKK